MSKMKSHNHEANQRGYMQPMAKPSPSTVKQVGITPPIQKPSPTSHDTSNLESKRKTGKPRQAEEAVSPGTDTSNGGM